MVATLYEPINVYKPLAPAIGVVDGPIEYLTSAGLRMPMPFTTRMTVIRLENGDLFLHSPIAFDQGLADELSRLGTIRHLISPNQFHYAHIGEWQRKCPRAIAGLMPARFTYASTATLILRHQMLGDRKWIRRWCPAVFSGSSCSFTKRRRR